MSMIGVYFKTSAENVAKIQQGQIMLSDLVYDEAQEENVLDIDKSWHAIYFTLTGTVWEGNDSIWSRLMLTEPVSDEDMGYGPATLSNQADVQALADALEKLSEEEFRKRFDVKEMFKNKVYPVMSDEDDEDFFTYVWACLTEMKQFFRKAASENACVLFYIG